MTVMKHSKNVKLAYLLSSVVCLGVVFGGCIHEYPSGGAVDPTEISLCASIKFAPEWKGQQSDYQFTTKSGDQAEARIIIECIEGDKTIGHEEVWPETADLSSEKFRHILPFKVKSGLYKLVVWQDYVGNDSDPGESYNANSLYEILDKGLGNGLKDTRDCQYASVDVDLRSYSDSWDSKIMIPVELRRPNTKFEIIATDCDDFIDFASGALLHGEKYTSEITLTKRRASAFNAVTGEAYKYVDSPGISIPISFSECSEGKISLGGECILINENVTEVSVSLSIMNSARVIVSKTSEIVIPVERGRLTKVSGRFLTNYYSNHINVNNIWDGEIEVEIE